MRRCCWAREGSRADQSQGLARVPEKPYAADAKHDRPAGGGRVRRDQMQSVGLKEKREGSRPLDW